MVLQYKRREIKSGGIIFSYLEPERIERFMEPQSFLLSYDSATRPPPPSPPPPLPRL